MVASGETLVKMIDHWRSPFGKQQVRDIRGQATASWAIWQVIDNRVFVIKFSKIYDITLIYLHV